MVLLLQKADMVAELLAVPVLLVMVMAVKEALKQQEELVQMLVIIILAHLVKEDQVLRLVGDLAELAAVAGMEAVGLPLIILVMMIKEAAVVLVMYIFHQLPLIIHLDVYLILLII